VGIISGSGGHGALAVDICSQHGLTIPTINQQQQSGIRADLSASVQPIASLSNPIDLTGSATDGDFMAAADMIESIDLNPVMCSAQECIVVDARIMLPPDDGTIAA
jgi:acyl-CoA synthetase (NDP forming)